MMFEIFLYVDDSIVGSPDYLYSSIPSEQYLEGISVALKALHPDKKVKIVIQEKE